MEKIIQKLASLAEELDSKNLSVQADTVDSITKTVLGVKTAQYVGIQGYWVRNSRCWGNCYRQKRSSNPEMPTQEVWSECHKEYTKAIDSDSARKDWDKYAGTEEGLVKTSARQDADAMLNEDIEKLLSAGSPFGQAVLSAISSQKDAESNFNKIIAASQSLVKIAESVEKSDFELATRIGKAAQELSKEAQWWNPKDWAAKSVRGLEDAGRAAGNWAQNRGQNQANAALSKAQQNADYFKQRGQNRGGQPAPAGSPNAAGAPGSAPVGGGSNISGPGIPGGGQGGGMYNPATAPYGTPGAADAISPILSSLSSTLKQLHEAVKGDEKQFKQLANRAAQMAGINLTGNPSTPKVPSAPAATPAAAPVSPAAPATTPAAPSSNISSNYTPSGVGSNMQGAFNGKNNRNQPFSQSII